MFDQVKAVIVEALQLDERAAAALRPDTPLIGNLPELDSMSVVTVISSLERHFDFAIDDDEIDADTFATLGSLADFVARKVDGQGQGARGQGR
jgi:acyl carrier protein